MEGGRGRREGAFLSFLTIRSSKLVRNFFILLRTEVSLPVS